VNLDKLIGPLSRDWEWLSFVTQYCAGRNIDKPICEDFMWWALVAAALVLAIVAWWILGKIAKAHESRKHRRMLAKVADAKTMNKYRWSGHDFARSLDFFRPARREIPQAEKP